MAVLEMALSLVSAAPAAMAKTRVGAVTGVDSLLSGGEGKWTEEISHPSGHLDRTQALPNLAS